MVLIAHLSDLHLDGSDERAERVRRLMAIVRRIGDRLDAVVVSGDVSQDGTAAQYADALALTAMPEPVPVLAVPGNADDRAAFRSVFLDESGGAGPVDAGSVNRVHHGAGATYLLVDTTVPGEVAGEVGEETLDWLAGAIRAARAERDAPIVLVQHHPPLRVWRAGDEPVYLRDMDRQVEVLRAAGGVSLILAGHYHVALATEVAGIPLRVVPGGGFTGRPDWELPPGDFRVEDRFEPAADPVLMVHEIDRDGRVVTVTRVASRS